MSLTRRNSRTTFVASHHSQEWIRYHHLIEQALHNKHLSIDETFLRLLERSSELADIAECLIQTLHAGKKILVIGNGGSAAEAQHFAAELVGRFKRERMPFPVLALTSDTSTLTAVSNDYGFGEVFARQVKAFGQPGDVLLMFSTSGESENLLRAAADGQHAGLHVIAVTGDRHSRLEKQANTTMRAPGIDTAAIQESHMMVTHILCDLVESSLIEHPEVHS